MEGEEDMPVQYLCHHVVPCVASLWARVAMEAVHAVQEVEHWSEGAHPVVAHLRHYNI